MLARISFCIVSAFTVSMSFAEVSRAQAEAAIERGINYFHSLANRGGYVYFVTPIYRSDGEKAFSMKIRLRYNRLERQRLAWLY